MIPTNVFAGTLSTLLATDTGSLAAVAAPKVAVIVAPFTPTFDMAIGDITLSVATGLTPIAGVAGPQLESVDPLTHELIVEMVEPAGGWRWETPPGFTGPVTVYGFALVDDGITVIFGTTQVTPPILLNAPNQSVNAPPQTFRIDPTKIT